MVHLAEENLKSHERIFDQIKLRTSRGVGKMADMDQAEARLAQARNNLITEQTNLADANTNYMSVVGQDARPTGKASGYRDRAAGHPG
jgi:adhesin transport system outer membrane protein